MSAPVEFLPQAELDLIAFVPLADHVAVLEAVIERLGMYPEIGVRLEPPDAWEVTASAARAGQCGLAQDENRPLSG